MQLIKEFKLPCPYICATDYKTFKRIFTVFLRKVKVNGAYAIDTETTGVRWQQDNLVMISLYTPGVCLIIPFGWGSNSPFPISQLAKEFKPLLKMPVKVYLHNAKFDMHFLHNHGVDFRHEFINDTLVMGFITDSTKPNKLKLRAPMECDIEMVEFKDKFKLGGKNKLTILDYPVSAVGKYAGLDVFATYSLAEKYCDWPEKNFFRLYEKIDRKMIPILWKMERRGIRVNTSLLKEYIQEEEATIFSIEKKLLKEAGVVFNMRSVKQVKEVFAKRGIITTSTDEKHLKQIAAGGDKLAGYMMEHREHSKLYSTTLKGVESVLTPDDHLHTSFNLHVAKTGRLSSSGDANVQNFPRDEKIRKLFIADKGKLLIVRDYSQIELRVLAVVSEDPVLLKEYEDGADVHRLNAALMYNKNPDDVTKEERQSAKAGLSFGAIYGMGAPALADMLKVGVDRAEHLLMVTFAKYKGVDRWIKRVQHSAMRCGYTESLFGRRLYLPKVKSPNYGERGHALREAANMPIQGGAADIVKLAMIAIDNDEELNDLGCEMLLQVHDEIVCQVPKENAIKANKRLEYVMSNFSMLKKFPIPFLTEGGIGGNWHEAKEGK